MKNNLFKLFVLFIAFILTVFTTIILIFIDIKVGFKIIIGIIGLLLSIIEYVAIKNLNQGNNMIVVQDEIIESFQQTSTKHLLCPKCYKPFDGEVCFYCGFKKEKHI